MPSTITPTGAVSITSIGALSLGAAEISAFDPASKRLYVTSDNGLAVVDLTNPAAPSLIGQLNLANAPYGGISTNTSSVAIGNGVVAAAVQNSNKTLPGEVIFLDAATGAFLGKVTVGAHPDSVTFTPDGTKVLVANEAEYVSGTTFSPGAKGSVSIIDISGGVAAATVQTAGFTAFDGQEAALRAEGVRIFPGQSVSDDVEPEYIAVSKDGTKAMVTLQEANAVALLDIATATITDIVALGSKDFSALLADYSDQDGTGGTAALNLVSRAVSGLYMPDAIASFESGGATYYVMANEGDDRNDFLPGTLDDALRVNSTSYTLDPTAFPDAATLETNAELGRLNVSRYDGDTDGDGDFDQIMMYGARSITIRDADGALVWDSGDMIERIVAQMVDAGTFPLATFDDRSDNKGPEPEGVTVGEVGGRTYAFVGLERANMSLVFDVTDPQNVTYEGTAARAGDLAPEGALFVAAEDSPTGTALYISSNEGDGGISVFEVARVPAFTLQLLHFADGEAGLLASDTAPFLAALVDAFDGTYANTLILAGGDNFIPGPFLNAGTDPSVQAVHGKGSNLGAADIQIHNLIGVQASTIGNHEFDLGTREFRDAVLDASFPYLSANLNFSADGELAPRYLETVGTGGLEEASGLAGRIVPSTVVSYGAEKVGLVGVTTQILEAISSTGGVEVKGFAGDGGETNDMALLAAQLQPVIDDLVAQGVNKIILMSHLQQIAFEQQLAPLLSGVDIILAAGSNTRLGDADDMAVAFPGHAANFAGPYPIVTFGADGGTTLIVNTDNEYTYLGRLAVAFDANGHVITDSLDPAVNGAYASTAENVAEAWGVDVADLETTAFAEGTKGNAVRDITDAVQAVIDAKDGQVWGYTDVYLEGERNIVRNQETNFGNLTADANKVAAEATLDDSALVVSLKNGGGIRAQIGSTVVATGEKIPPIANPGAGKPEGGISQLDIENALRFNNKLVVFDTTAAGLKTIVEHGFASLGNQGRFPQFGGVAVSYDPDLAAGSRVLSMALIDEAGNVIARLVENGQVVAGAPATISVVTLNFLANGGDGYPMKANGENFRFLLADGTISAALAESVDFSQIASVAAPGGVPAGIWNAALGEQQALAEFLQANHATPGTAYDTPDTAAALDERIQNLNVRAEDTVLDGETQAGTAGSDSIDGTVGDDMLGGADGRDTLIGLDGQDSLDGGDGRDMLQGGNGRDTLVGGNAEDRLEGGAGADLLDGGRNGDVLSGGEGADTLVGGGGADSLTGDGGADVFLFAAASDSRPANAARQDVILDFVRGVDRIALAFDADNATVGIEDFVFAAGAFAAGEPGRVRIEDLGDDVLLLANVNGDTEADFAVLVKGVGTLDATDLIL